MASFTEQIESLVDEILDSALEKREFDAVDLIARQLPMRMPGRIIGVPDEDLPWLVERGDELIANADPDNTQHVIDKVDTDKYRLMPFRSPAGALVLGLAAGWVLSGGPCQAGAVRPKEKCIKAAKTPCTEETSRTHYCPYCCVAERRGVAFHDASALMIRARARVAF